MFGKLLSVRMSGELPALVCCEAYEWKHEKIFFFAKVMRDCFELSGFSMNVFRRLSVLY